jgi:hypothetical protein
VEEHLAKEDKEAGVTDVMREDAVLAFIELNLKTEVPER